MRVFAAILTLFGVGNAGAMSAPDINTDVESVVAAGLTHSGLQNSEISVKPEISGDITTSLRYTLIPKFTAVADSEIYVDNPNERNYDSINGPWQSSRHGEALLSEAYLDFPLLAGYWRVGKQQVVWGQADGLKVLDVVNPQDYREFNLDEFEDSRIPLWMVNAEFNVTDDSTFQVLIIPDNTYSKLADPDTPYEITSSKFRPALGASPVPVIVHDIERPERQPEFGARYRMFYHGWDLTLNYLYHRQDSPVIYRRFNAGQVDVTPMYKLNNLFGATASNAFGDWVLRMEAGYNTDTYQLLTSLDDDGIAVSPEFSSVIGLDYRGFTDWFLSYQIFQSTLTDYTSDIVRNRTRVQQTLLVRRSLFNETAELEFFALYSDEDQDGQFRTEASYLVSDALRVWAGVDLFYGDADGQFGQFDETDRAVVGLEFGF